MKYTKHFAIGLGVIIVASASWFYFNRTETASNFTAIPAASTSTAQTSLSATPVVKSPSASANTVSQVAKPVVSTTSHPSPTQSIKPVSSDVINWSAKRNLTWADFQGAQGPWGKAAVSVRIDFGWTRTYTCENIESGIRCTSRVQTVKAIAQANPLESWYITSEATDYRLAHEQDHFNITEYFARKGRNALASYVGYEVTAEEATTVDALSNGANQISQVLDGLINPIEKEHADTQIQYDDETDHSVNQSAQSAWHAKISNWLSI